MKRKLTVVLVVGLAVCLVFGLAVSGASAASAAGNLLSNGNFDAHHSVEVDPLRYPGMLNEQPDNWEMDSDFNLPNPFLDGFSSELWAGGAPSPDTGPEDYGIFFKTFWGGAPFPGDLNPTITTHMTQDQPAAPGTTYVLTGWAAAESNYSGFVAAGGQTYFALDFLNGGGGIIQSLTFDLEANGLAIDPRDALIESPWNWTEYVLMGVAPVGTAIVRTRVSVFDGFYNIDPGQAFVVDDFTLVAVPEPGSWLLAVLAFGGVTRRNKRPRFAARRF